jgi:hypothetical protein
VRLRRCSGALPSKSRGGLSLHGAACSPFGLWSPCPQPLLCNG